MALTITATYLAGLALLYLTLITHVSRGAVVIGYTVVAALSAGYAAVQLWRMPPEMRPPVRTRRVALALGAVYSAILIAMITVAVTPARALSAALLAATALIFASAFVVRAMLRRKKGSTVGQTVTRDRAA